MPVSNDILKKKTMGFIQSIEKMGANERKEKPSGSYGDDYNRLWQLVVEANTELREVMPPKVETYDNSYFGKLTNQSYAEIYTFCSQIYQLIS